MSNKQIRRIVLYSFMALLGLAGSLVVYPAIFQNYQINSPKITPVPTHSSTPSPTIKAAKTALPAVAAVNNDPIINCLISSNCGGGSQEMKKSECSQTTCCQIGDKWYFYLSKTKCQQDQKSQTGPTFNPPTIPTYNAPTYYSCTLYYPILNKFETYDYLYKTKEECDAAQANLNNSYLPTPTQKSAEEIQKCKDAVSAKYQSLITGCYVQYQGSAADACARGYQDLSSNENKACEL